MSFRVLRLRSASGFEPPIRQFGLQCIVVERIFRPQILLPEPDDVELLGRGVVTVPVIGVPAATRAPGTRREASRACGELGPADAAADTPATATGIVRMTATATP